MSKKGVVRRDLFAAGGAGAAALVLGSLLGANEPGACRRKFRPQEEAGLGSPGGRRLEHSDPRRPARLLRHGRMGLSVPGQPGLLGRKPRRAGQQRDCRRRRTSSSPSWKTPGMTPTFKQAMSKGIVMVIIDQGVPKEAEALGLGIIGEDPLNSGYNNGWQGGELRPAADRQDRGRRSSSATATPAPT